MTIYLKKITCKYYSYKVLWFISNGSTEIPPRVDNVYQICGKCNIRFCDSHSRPYHNWVYDNSIHPSIIDDEIGEIYQVFLKLVLIQY